MSLISSLTDCKRRNPILKWILSKFIDKFKSKVFIKKLYLATVCLQTAINGRLLRYYNTLGDYLMFLMTG